MHPKEINVLKDDTYALYLYIAESLSVEHVKALNAQRERQQKFWA